MEMMNFLIYQDWEKIFLKTIATFPKKSKWKGDKKFEWAYNKTTTAIDSTNHYLKKHITQRIPSQTFWEVAPQKRETAVLGNAAQRLLVGDEGGGRKLVK